MQKSIVTIERKRLLSFLTEIEIFLLTSLPELCEECPAIIEIQNIKELLSLPRPNLDTYSVSMKQFVLNVRNCIRMRASLIGSLEADSINIHISQWAEIKSRLSSETPKEDLLLIANKLIDEAFIHLSEVLLDLMDVKSNSSQEDQGNVFQKTSHKEHL